MTINNSPVDLLQNQKWESVPWKTLQVGDIIRVSTMQIFVYFFKHLRLSKTTRGLE